MSDIKKEVLDQINKEVEIFIDKKVASFKKMIETKEKEINKKSEELDEISKKINSLEKKYKNILENVEIVESVTVKNIKFQKKYMK